MDLQKSSEATGASTQLNSGKRIDRVSALVWFVVGGVVVQQSLSIEYLAEYGPGPGFFPFWLGVGLMVASLGLVLETVSARRQEEAVRPPSRYAALQMLVVIVAFFVFVYLTDKAGFLLSVGLLFLFLLRVAERRTWRLSLSVSALSVFLLWIVFEFGLKMRLPTGFLELLG